MERRAAISWALVLVAVAVGLTIQAWPQLPDPMPTHWGPAGRPDGWLSRAVGAWLVPAWALIFALCVPLADRCGETAEDRQANTLPAQTMILAMVAFMVVVQALILAAARAVTHELSTAGMFGALGGLFAVLGWVLPRLRPNRWMGIRTREIIADRELWRKTHAFAGPLYTVSGALLALTPWLGLPLVPVVVAVVICLALAPLLYSVLVRAQRRRAI